MQSGPLEEIARTFGVDWPHLVAQLISFAIVCLVLQVLAYKPILKLLEARRQQIAHGLANAEKITAKLAQIERERRTILANAEADAKRLIDDARAVAARVGRQEVDKAVAAAAEIVARAHAAAERDRDRLRAELKQQIGRLVVQTTAMVAGRVLTAEDDRRLVEETARQLT